MNITKSFLTRPNLRGLVLALAVTALASYVARAVPYASQISQSGNTVSFILNQNAQALEVVRNPGASKVYPGTTAGQLSFDMTGYTSYEIIVTGNTPPGWSQHIADGTDRNFYIPVGVCINKNPASTNFGKVYISEATGGPTTAGRTTSDGIYMLRADGVAAGFSNGGQTWPGGSSPWKSTIGPDDHLYVSDKTNDKTYEFNDDLSVATQLTDASNLAANQWVCSIWVEGTRAQGNRKIYLIDDNIADTVNKGLIMYDLGANATAIGLGTGTQIIGPSYYSTYYPFDVARDSAGNWYVPQFRWNPAEAPAVSKFDGSLTPPINTALWETPLTAPYSGATDLDVNDRAGVVAFGHYYDGFVHILAMADGAYVEGFDAGSRIRALAYDAAGNIVTVDNLAEYARFWSPGGYTVATTKSDGTFTLTKPTVNVSVTANPDTTSMDLNQPPGVFTLTRTGDTSAALPVGYTLSGTATNGVHYQTLAATVTFQVGESSKGINVVAIPGPAGPTRSVILTLNSSNSYAAYPPVSGTVWIVDTNKPSIQIAARSTQFYERTNDYARFRLTRWGDTNVYLGQVNVTYAGTATAGTQYYGTASTNMSYGDLTMDVFAFPIHDGVVTGPKTVTATVAPASDASYVVGTPATSAAVTRVDADDPPETVLFADNFDTDSSANWTLRYAARNGVPDYTTTWAYDYSVASIPPAPHSPAGNTVGLYLDVNKNQGAASDGGAAGLNLYPNGQSFSGNYALRFDMFLMVGGTSYTTEYGLCGINHSGNQTNWFRGPSTSNNPNDGVGSTWAFDGEWVSIEADASGTDDYMIMSAPAVSPSGIWGPTTYATAGAGPFTGVFKSPPYFTGGLGGGSPANAPGYPTAIWADVELSQVGNVVTLTINHTPILSYTNTTLANSGNIMVGYCDAYDSVLVGSGVVIDNLRVVRLAASLAPASITGIAPVGGPPPATYTIKYSGGSGSQFVLVTSPTVNAPLSGWSRIATNSTGSGTFSVPAGTQGFYRIKSE